MTALHGPRGNEWTQAFGMNNLGQVVGSCSAKAALWENGQVYDLNTLIPPGSGWILSRGIHINDQGLIVGEGQYHGKTASFLLVPLSNTPGNIPQADPQTAAAGTSDVGTMP
jgi:probable HAF family extracellular repeat protein